MEGYYLILQRAAAYVKFKTLEAPRRRASAMFFRVASPEL
jgi:hypothetical protein